MTSEQLQEILSSTPSDIVTKLKKSSYDIPLWSELKVQYDPMSHKIMNEKFYPKKLDDNNIDEFKRTPLALQWLAVNRSAQVLFASPVDRVYSYEESGINQKAEDIIENLYSVQNKIDAENIERAKSLGSTCQCATIWYLKEKPSVVAGIQSKYTLCHKTYSEDNGYKLYPQIDEYGDLIVLAISQTDSDDVEYFDIYTQSKYIRLENNGGTWNEVKRKDNSFMPISYIYRKDPSWGGDAGTSLVEQLEEMESFQGMYIAKNSDPTYAMYAGKNANASNTSENPQGKRKVIKLGDGGFVKDVTWQGANEAVNSRHKRLRNSFFEHIQLADNSFSTMIASNTSADNKELIYADVKAKAIDIGGEWIVFFSQELEIVMSFAKVMFPQYAQAIESLSITTKINPYSVNTLKDSASIIDLAGNSMSLETKVRTLKLVKDYDKEVERINNENAAIANSSSQF